MKTRSYAPRPSIARLPHQHDRPVDAVGIWLVMAALVCALDAFRDAALNMGDVRGIVVGAVVVYLAARLMDGIAARLGPPFSTSKVTGIDSRTLQ